MNRHKQERNRKRMKSESVSGIVSETDQDIEAQKRIRISTSVSVQIAKQQQHDKAQANGINMCKHMKAISETNLYEINSGQIRGGQVLKQQAQAFRSGINQDETSVVATVYLRSIYLAAAAAAL